MILVEICVWYISYHSCVRLGIAEVFLHRTQLWPLITVVLMVWQIIIFGRPSIAAVWSETLIMDNTRSSTAEILHYPLAQRNLPLCAKVVNYSRTSTAKKRTTHISSWSALTLLNQYECVVQPCFSGRAATMQDINDIKTTTSQEHFVVFQSKHNESHDTTSTVSIRNFSCLAF